MIELLLPRLHHQPRLPHLARRLLNLRLSHRLLPFVLRLGCGGVCLTLIEDRQRDGGLGADLDSAIFAFEFNARVDVRPYRPARQCQCMTGRDGAPMRSLHVQTRRQGHSHRLRFICSRHGR